jgi:hypothetical protein
VLIKAYGLFWRADEVDWEPGRGRKFQVLGRVGEKRPGLRVADFRIQSGLYILYGDYGPYYVGLTRSNRLGARLRAHLRDHHTGRWDRFSWFGFRQVLAPGVNGVSPLKTMPKAAVGNPNDEIRDMEALLIHALGLSSNLNKTNFGRADQWFQVKADEADRYLGRILLPSHRGRR